VPDTGRLAADESGGLGVALNESDLLTVQVQPESESSTCASGSSRWPPTGGGALRESTDCRGPSLSLRGFRTSP